MNKSLQIVSGSSKILDCSQLFEPKEFLDERWEVQEQDERALAFTQVDFAQARFEICLRGKEDKIKGKEKLRRFKEKRLELIPHGGNQFWALWQDYEKNGKDSVLEWLCKDKKITYLDFFGLILRSPDGDLCVLSLCWGGDCWGWSYYWLDGDWNARRFSVVSSAS